MGAGYSSQRKNVSNMSILNVVLQESALLLLVLLPLAHLKRQNKRGDSGISNLAVNEKGYLEEITGNYSDQHHMR